MVATCSATAITRCPNGYKKNAAGDGCVQCPIGQDSSDGLNCLGCGAGFFKPDLSYVMCVKCPDGSPSCGGSSVSCQTGYYYDSNVQCKRNDTYFALVQTATNTVSTVTNFVTVMCQRSRSKDSKTNFCLKNLVGSWNSCEQATADLFPSTMLSVFL